MGFAYVGTAASACLTVAEGVSTPLPIVSDFQIGSSGLTHHTSNCGNSSEGSNAFRAGVYSHIALVIAHDLPGPALIFPRSGARHPVFF